GSPDQLQQLQSEVSQLAQLDSVQGIVALKEANLNAERPYYVMSYAERGSLAERLEKQKQLPLAEALSIFRQVAEALAYAHARATRHCDLKPGNILLDALGRPLIADFGQAHLSMHPTDRALGTFFYMAPEQADTRPQVPDTRWDVYGLGALFSAMLTGQPPRADAEVHRQLRSTASLSHRLDRYREWIQRAPAPTAHRQHRGMDNELATILDRCLATDPAQRLRDAGTVLEALKRRKQHRRQRPILVFGLLAPLLLLLASVGPIVWAGAASIDQSQSALTEQLQNSD